MILPIVACPPRGLGFPFHCYLNDGPIRDRRNGCQEVDLLFFVCFGSRSREVDKMSYRKFDSLVFLHWLRKPTQWTRSLALAPKSAK